MLRNTTGSMLIASCAFLALCHGAAMATDLTLYGWKNGLPAKQGAKPAASKDKRDASPAAGDKRPARKQEQKNGKAAHAETGHQRRILTYSLPRDRLFHLETAKVDPRNAERLTVLGGGIGAAAVPLALPVAAPRPARAVPVRTEVPDTAGIGFGCRERPFSSTLARREFTACFRHNVDRSWKTQTYVSRGVIEGTQTWGGGLTIAYDY